MQCTVKAQHSTAQHQIGTDEPAAPPPGTHSQAAIAAQLLGSHMPWPHTNTMLDATLLNGC